MSRLAPGADVERWLVWMRQDGPGFPAHAALLEDESAERCPNESVDF